MSRPKRPPFRLSCVLASCVVLLLNASPLHSQVFTRVSSGTTNHLRSVDFRDDSIGIAAGDFGTIIRSTNGGLTWAASPSGTSAHLLCVRWLSDSTVIAAGYSGLVLRSTDAGLTWSPVPSGTSLPLTDCDAWDPLHAIAVGYNGIILRTSDGGASWATAAQVAGSNHFGIAYADSLAVSVCGTSGRMLRSTDGGTSWTWQAFGGSTFLDVDFVDSTNGVAAGSGGGVLRSSDAGASWTTVPLAGTFDDIDHGVDGSIVAAGIGTAVSADRGATWSARKLPVRLRGVAAFDSARYVLVGDDGTVLRTVVGPIDPPPPELSLPVDGEPAAPLSPAWRQEFSLTLSWRGYTAYFPDSVRIQVGFDPDFSGTIFFDSSYALPAVPDSHRIVTRIFPGKPHYWRIRMEFGGVETPWSETRSFTGSVAGASAGVAEIQAVHEDSLLAADSLTSIARDRWRLQASTLLEKWRFLTVRCAAPPEELYDPFYQYQGASDGRFFYAVDTGLSGPDWRGIKVTPGWYWGSDLVEAFSRVRRGDLVVCAGMVSEDPTGEMDSETSFYTTWLFVLDTAGAATGPAPASVGDFFRLSGHQLLPAYSTGEPFEGGLVELTNLTVHSIEDPSNGTFNVTDRSGATIGTADYSRWFTLRSHRDPASGYSTPFAGEPIDTLRGFISTTGGDVQSWSFPRYRIVPVVPGDIVYGVPTGNLLRGSVFYDSSRNGLQDGGEPGIPDWRIHLGGIVSTTLTTLPDGSFAVEGIDSGAYSLGIDLPEGWFLSTEVPPTMEFTLGLGDTLESTAFGIFYGWNSVSGVVFEDLNENGSRDEGEPGLPGILVRLGNGMPDSMLTGPLGKYAFYRLKKEMDTVSIIIPPRWEQIVPLNGAGYDLDYGEYDQHLTGRDFSLRRSPFRLKITLTVRDAGEEAMRRITFGTRPGASYGVWGADTAATFIDFSEGEFEIPPQLLGLFDARFVDPRGGLASFGEGTWTDVREYRSPGQVDSFRIDFQPGVYFGGSYPMRFYWSGAEVDSAYAGDVFLGDSEWKRILEMKSAGSFIVTDTSTTILTIVAEGPVLRLSDAPAGPVEAPAEFALLGNYPNPFNPGTFITYEVSVRDRILIRIYDLLGREVGTLVDEVKPPGRYVEEWRPGPLPSGVYFCRMAAGRYAGAIKLMFVR
jgi:photosystem II stability/assembly factor-like uncharacterized protein